VLIEAISGTRKLSAHDLALIGEDFDKTYTGFRTRDCCEVSISLTTVTDFIAFRILTLRSPFWWLMSTAIVALAAWLLRRGLVERQEQLLQQNLKIALTVLLMLGALLTVTVVKIVALFVRAVSKRPQAQPPGIIVV